MNNSVSNNTISQQSSLRVTIGLPVFNGERLISKRIENILSQTFSDFELVISDNASTDDTRKICEEYFSNDKRIRYYRQKMNIGIHENFKFVLEQSKNKLFVWASSDDHWEKNFLEEIVIEFSKQKNLVGCTSQVESFGATQNDRILGSNKRFANTQKSIKSHFSKFGAFSVSGDFKKKIRKYLYVNSAQMLYGIFQTGALKKSWIDDHFIGRDLAIILNLLKYGNFYVIDKKLIQFSDSGHSSVGIIKNMKNLGYKNIQILFPFLPFTKWFIKNIGLKLFLQNSDLICKMNLGGNLAVIFDLMYKKQNKQ